MWKNLQRGNSGFVSIKSLLVVAVFTAIIVGFLVYKWQGQKIINLQNELHGQKQQVARLQQKVTANEKEYLFRVYSANADYTSEEVSFLVAVPEELSLMDKMKLLADKVSRFVFTSHPISVLRIEKRLSKQIAILDLREPTIPNAYTWAHGYFQGSTGGSFTTLTLRKTFLQKDFPGKWVDGIEVYYQGKPISPDWDHIALAGTIYRK